MPFALGLGVRGRLEDGRAVENAKLKALKQIRILLQSPFFIVCLNQDHFFSQKSCLQNIMRREVGSGGKGYVREHECP
jgi:hypothetical protein